MKNQFRRRVLAFAAVACVALTSACGSSDGKSAGGDKGTAQPAETTVALVSPQASGDKGAIDALISGLDQEAKARNLKTRFVYVSDPSTAAATISGLAKSGTDIILTAFAFSNEVEAAAAEYPDTKFVQLLAAPIKNETPNDLSLVGAVVEPYYLAGAAAGALSSSGKVGYIGGSPSPLVEQNANVMAEGVKKADPSGSLKVAWANSYQDPAKGQQLATALFASGVDIVLPDASGTNAGVYKAVTSDAQNIVDVSVNGVDGLTLPERTPGVVALKFEQIVHIAIDDAMKANGPSGTKELTYADNVADFEWNPAFKPTPEMTGKLAEAKALVASLRKQLLNGTLKVG